ncbi:MULTISPECIES: TetR/AcrR family transcriptional regulator [unclassified Nocardia]|uniref:TetR/AcrR family transcriptional regulator n=1 Tax=unclassified Nocardia TaxID=2637762 RepID=UPI001CE449A5|nr:MULTISPECIES: TetR/AcrR family transcriptional regulator [unclassified Nocardia]
MVRRRMSPEQRRGQLLDIGAALFAEMPYEDVLMEVVAERAGVTRGLMYHYFPTKRDFYAAVFRRASDRLLSSTELDDDRSFEEIFASGLDAHIQYFVDHPREALSVNRGALSGDPVIQAIIAEELTMVGQRILDKLGLQGHARELAAVAIHGWLVFVRAVCVEWIESRTITRDELTALCLRAFRGAMEPVLGER